MRLSEVKRWVQERKDDGVMINICLTEEVVKRLEETEDGQKLLSEFHVSLQELTAIADRITNFLIEHHNQQMV